MNRALICLICAQIIQHAAMSGARLIMPLTALSQDYSAASVGVLLACFSLAQIFLALPAGAIAERYGFFIPVCIGATLATLGTLASFFFPIFPVFCLTALATGGATGLIIIAQQRYAGNMANNPQALRKIFSTIALGPAVASFIGPLTAGFMLDHYSFHKAIGVMLLAPLCSIVFAYYVREEKSASPEKSTQKIPAAWTLLSDKAFRRLMIINVILGACWDANTFMVPILGYERGFSATAIGSILGAFAVAAFTVRILLPVISRHLAEFSIITYAMWSASAVLLVYPLMPNPVLMGFASVILGFALGSVQPMVMSMLHQMLPHNRHAQAISLRIILVNISSVSVPIALGSVGAIIGIAPVFWMASAVVGAGSRLSVLMKKQQEKAAK